MVQMIFLGTSMVLEEGPKMKDKGEEKT